MAIFVRESPTLTNRDAKPMLSGVPGAVKPIVRSEVVVAVTGDSATSQYGFFSMPSSAILDSLALSNDALSASTACNIGLYETTLFPASLGVFGSVIAGGIADARYNASALVNTNQCFGATTAFTSAGTRVQIKYANSSFYTFTKAEQPIWKMLGFTNDPFRDFDLVVTVTTAVVAGGAIVLDASWRNFN